MERTDRFREGVSVARCSNSRMVPGRAAVGSCLIVLWMICVNAALSGGAPLPKQGAGTARRAVIQAPTEGQHCAIWSYALPSAHICTACPMHNYFASPYVHPLVRLLLRCSPNWLFKKYKYCSSGICPCPDSSFYPSVTITCAIQALCTSRQSLLDHLGCVIVCGLRRGEEERNLLKAMHHVAGLPSSQSSLHHSPALISSKSLATTQQVFNWQKWLLKESRQFKECDGEVCSPMILAALQQKEF